MIMLKYTPSWGGLGSSESNSTDNLQLADIYLNKQVANYETVFWVTTPKLGARLAKST